MPEQTAMETVKLFTSVLAILFIVALAVFMLNLNSVNDYQQYVNYQIERHGGLTGEAVDQIEDYNKAHANGRYDIYYNNGGHWVDPAKQPQTPKSYGEEISYKFTGTIRILFFEVDPFQVTREGSANSQIRG